MGSTALGPTSTMTTPQRMVTAAMRRADVVPIPSPTSARPDDDEPP